MGTAGPDTATWHCLVSRFSHWFVAMDRRRRALRTCPPALSNRISKVERINGEHGTARRRDRLTPGLALFKWLLLALFAFDVSIAFADPHDGTGTMTILPGTVFSSSAGNSFTLSFSPVSGQKFPNSSLVTVQVPTGWTVPQTTNSSSAGFVSAAGTGSGTINSV